MLQVLSPRDSEPSRRVVQLKVCVEVRHIYLAGLLADVLENYLVLVGRAGDELLLGLVVVLFGVTSEVDYFGKNL